MTTRLRVRLRDVVPEAVRVMDVPTASTLPEVHDLLQTGVGWTASHLHQFVAGTCAKPGSTVGPSVVVLVA